MPSAVGCIARAALLVPSFSNPEKLGLVGLEPAVVGHERQSLDPGLGDQHAIEGVSVVRRKPAGFLSMREADREPLEATIPNSRLECVR